ncbi:MAG: S1 RNA-binding domain-containing protein [Candidatus Woesearchaeota archaeon]
MLYKKKGMPEEGEIILCKVIKIFPNSVFVDLLEYDNKQGMIHISEISPGRIRNLRDYVTIGKQIICKVLRIDLQAGHIDVSLRRVNSTQAVEKLEEIKQEAKAESLLENLAKKLSVPFKSLYSQVTEKVFKSYSHLYLCFKEVVAGECDLQKLGLDKTVAQELTEAIKDKFRPPKIEISGEIRLETYAQNGLDKIKKTLAEIAKISPKIILFYLGAGRYKFRVEDVDYKSAEKKFKKAEGILEKFKDKISQASFIRE